MIGIKNKDSKVTHQNDHTVAMTTSGLALGGSNKSRSNRNLPVVSTGDKIADKHKGNIETGMSVGLVDLRAMASEGCPWE